MIKALGYDVSSSYVTDVLKLYGREPPPALTPTAALGDAAAVTAVTSAVVAALQRHSDSARLETLGNEVLDVLDDGAPEAAAVKLALLVLVRNRSRSSRLL